MKKEILIPRNQSEITIAEFEAMQELSKLDTNELDKVIKIVSLFTNLTQAECARLKPHSLEVIADKINTALTTPADFDWNNFTIENYRFFNDSENITLGEYVDAINILKNDESKISRFTALFLRKSYKYTTDIEKRAQIALKCPYLAFVQLSEWFSKLNEEIEGAFPNLYAAPVTSSKTQGMRDALSEKWGWYIQLHKLAEHVTRIDEITELNLWTALTWLSYEADVDAIKASDLQQ